MEYILFSPVSDRDPCSADAKYSNVYRDGALLHIVRQYQPQTVRLFFTDRFWQLEEKDGRYTTMLRHVCPQIKIQPVKCPNSITNAALFDQFDSFFRQQLEELHQQYPDQQLLVNLSSGTPQMQAALYLLAATLPFNVQSVQVMSPVKGSNVIRDRYDPTLSQTRLGEDGGITDVTDIDGKAVDFTEKRCRDVSCQNAVRTIMAENIGKLVNGHDYTAALALYSNFEELFSPELKHLLDTAFAHINLDRTRQRQVINDGGNWEAFYEPCIRSLPKKAQNCYDYLLYLTTLIDRKALSDYARAFSPALTTIMQMRLENAGHSISRFCKPDGNGVTQIRRDKISATEPGFMEYLDNQYNRGFRGGPLSAIHMLYYMKYIRKRTGIDLDVNVFDRLRSAEINIRHPAAHELTGITANQIKNRTGDEAQVLLNTLKEQYQKAWNIPSLNWDSLQKLEQKIQDELQSHA